MKVVVDTNIIFSAILNADGKIGEIILRPPANIKFYAPAYLLEELETHSIKLQKISKLSTNNILRLQNLIFQKIKFIDTDIIGDKYWKEAAKLCFDIDKDDIDFIVLTEFLKATLWTGDNKLIKGLEKKGYNKVINTTGLYSLLRN